MRVGPAPKVQHDTAEEARPKRIPQLAQAAEVGVASAFCGFDLDSRHRPVVAFQNQVDLVTVGRTSYLRALKPRN